MRYHHRQVRNAVIKSLQIINNGKVMENRRETPLKTKNKLPYDPSIPLLDIYLEGALIWKDTCIPIFIAALFTIVKTQNQPKCPLTDEWKRQKVVHIYNGILKSRHHFTDKGPFSQSYGFSRSHVQMWELNNKGWVLKNWCFQIVVLQKTRESFLDFKEIKPINPKGNQPWIHWKDWC